MDAKYAQMDASGKPFDFNSFEGRDWYTLMGDLDRRSLYAQSIMSQQQGLAMGLYSGPTSQQGKFVDPFFGDHAERMKAAVKFLDGVSNDEKTSIAWAASRAGAQSAYEWIMEGEGKTPERLDSPNLLVRLLMAAMSTMKDNMERGVSTGPIETADDLKRQPWFKGFEAQLDAAIQQTQAMYQTKSPIAADASSGA